MINIKVTNLTKVIKGNTVLNDVTLNLESGKVYGFYGRNGSGKTMLFRAISGLIFATKGDVEINGKKLHVDIQTPDNIGVLIENPGFFPYLSGLENLTLLGDINKKVSHSDISKIMEVVGLDPLSKKKFKAYSLGMKQKLGIAQAIMEKPDILILDEPTNGLDEEGVSMIRNIVQSLKKEGKLIIMASHNKEDLSLLCDIIYKMENGAINGEIDL